MSDRRYSEPVFPKDSAHKLVVLVGASGAGKSSWCSEYVARHADESWRIINGDAIRLAYAQQHGIDYRQAHDEPHATRINELFDATLFDAVKNGEHILVDTINTRREVRNQLVEKIERMATQVHGAEHYYDARAAVVFLVTEEEALARNAQRIAASTSPRVVGEAFIRQFVSDVNEGRPEPKKDPIFTQFHYRVSGGWAQQHPGQANMLASPAASQRREGHS